MKNNRGKLKRLLVASLFLALTLQIIGESFVETQAYEEEEFIVTEMIDEETDSNSDSNNPNIEDEIIEDEIIEDEITEDEIIEADEVSILSEEVSPRFEIKDPNSMEDLHKFLEDEQDYMIVLHNYMNYEFTKTAIIPAGYTKILINIGAFEGLNVYFNIDTGTEKRHIEVNGTLEIQENIFVSGRNLNNEIKGGGIEVKNGGTLTLFGGIIEDCVSAYGGAVKVEAGTLNLLGTGTIRNCESTNEGGAIHAGANSTVVIGELDTDNPKILNCKTTEKSGGAIYSAGQVFMNSGTIEGCSTVAEWSGGGAIYSAVQVTLKGGVIKNCSSSLGGAIRVDGGTVQLTGTSTIDNCTAQSGGGAIFGGANSTIIIDSSSTNVKAISNCTTYSGNGGAISSEGKVELKNGTIDGCKAPADWVGGGAIHSIDEVIITGGTISDCSAFFGGAINSNGKVTINGGKITDCHTTDSEWWSGGGAVYSTNELTITSGIIEKCTSDMGGAIYSNGNVTITGGTISECESVDVSAGGGAIYSEGQVTLEGGLIEKCTAINVGGAIYSKLSFTMKGGTIEDCKSLQGGAVYSPNGKVVITGDSTIANSVSSINGGAVFIDWGSQLSVTDSVSGLPTIIDCKSLTGNGGAIFSYGPVDIQVGLIENCTSTTGIGGAIYTNNRLSIDNTTINNCYALQNGGAIYIEKSDNFTGTSTITNSTIENCKSEVDAGGVFAKAVKLNITNTDIKKCESQYGAGIYASLSEVILSEVKMSGNTVTSDGGAITADKSSIVIKDNTIITECSAGSHGGAIYAGEDSYIEFAADSTDNTIISKSHSIGGNAGAIVLKGEMVMNGGTISECTASSNAGAIYVDGQNAKLTINNGLIENNVAGNGGGIFVLSGELIMKKGTISNCTAQTGGGITAVGGKVTIKGTGTDKTLWPSIVDCTATTAGWWGAIGGGIFSQGSGKVTLDKAIVDGCKAEFPNNDEGKANGSVDKAFGSGGGIFAYQGSEIDLNEVEITNNTASFHGGGVFTTDYNKVFTTVETYFNGNSALFYKVPANTLKDETYPCTKAQNISPDSDIVFGREFPLNNFDINYLSGYIRYMGNGGFDNKTNKSQIDVYHEYVPFTDDLDKGISGEVSLPIYDNSSNDYFKFEKVNRKFGIWASDDKYIITGLEEYKDSKTISASHFLGDYPLITAYALWKKEVSVEKEVVGDFANLFDKFTINLTYSDAEGVPYSDEVITAHNLKSSIELRHKGKEVQDIYEGSYLSVQEEEYPSYKDTVFMVSKSNVIGEEDERVEQDLQNLVSIENYDRIVVLNEKQEITVTGINTNINHITILLLLGLLSLVMYPVYRSRLTFINKETKKQIKRKRK
ncbi:MAG: hypothetical protein ACK5LL_06995 [Suipraeoptans sp.]